VKDRTLQPGGINCADRSITIDGGEVYLGSNFEIDEILRSRPASEKVIRARHERAQDLSDAIWLREYGTIPGAPERAPSRKAIALSKIKPDS
jgi:hypothetical protein